MVLAFESKTDRLMSRVAIALFSLGAIFGLYSFGRPLYWRFYATVLRPFEDNSGFDVLDDDPFSAAEAEKHLHGKVIAKPAAVVVPKPPFDVSNFPLTKERVHKLKQNGYIMVTWANHHYVDFARSWVYHVKQSGITGYLVGAMDDEMLKSLYDMDIQTWRMNSGITKDDLGWGSPNFHKMGRAKISLIKQFLELDVIMIISDIDTAWLKNPLPYFDRYPEADILTSTDELRGSTKDDTLERWPEAGASFNIGIMMFRPKSIEFVNEWIKALQDPKMWDQTAFNDLVRKGASSSDPKNKFLWKGDNGKLTVGILPASIFASGHMFFVQTKYKELGLEPYVAHATYQYSGTPGKKHRFREFLLWDDPPEYFDDSKGFVYLKIDVPKKMLDKAKGVQGEMTADKLVNHFELVHYQLQRLRTALAIATMTGRVIIMPPIWCEIDKYWAPLHDGNIPGSKFIKPFICPMDHIFDIEGWWNRPLAENEFGPNLKWREYSFLQNPKLSPAVNNSRLIIQPCGATCKEEVDVANVKDGKLAVKASVAVPKLREALLSPAASAYKIIELGHAALETLSGLWNTFPGPEQERFTRRLKHLTSVVCCLNEQPGWIWYDFLADIPHEDRFNRKFEGQGKWVFYKGDQSGLAKTTPKALLASS